MREPRVPFSGGAGDAGRGGGDGGGAAGDATDDRIRALLARAVSSAPPAPPAADIEAPAVRPTAAVVRPTGAPPPPLPSGARRAVLVVAASVAILLMVVVVRGPSGDSDRAVGPGELAVRFVPGEVPPGLRLSSVASAAAIPAAPRHRVSVLEGGGVVVRITEGPPGWAAETPATTVPATVPGPGPGATETTLPPEPGSTTTTVLPPGTVAPSGPGSTTTTLPPTTMAPAPPPPLAGLPARAGIRATSVRGTTGGQEVHDGTTSTVWFEDGDRLVAVDVFGLDPAGAVRLVDGLTTRADGGFDPAPVTELIEVAAAPAATAVEPFESAQLVYTDEATGEPGLVVTTEALPPGRHDRLVATAGSFGRLDRWGGRDVLVDGDTVAFVDPTGALVTVQAAGAVDDDLQAHVDLLRPLDRRSWEQLVADHPELTVPPTPSPTG